MTQAAKSLEDLTLEKDVAESTRKAMSILLSQATDSFSFGPEDFVQLKTDLEVSYLKPLSALF